MKVCIWIVLHCVVQICGRQILVDKSRDQGQDRPRSVRFVDRGVNETNIVVTSTASPRKEEEKWVVDSIYYDQYQSDSPATGDPVPDFCPPVPEIPTDEACALNTCTSDTDCKDSERCCYNGCMYTCLLEIKPAPVLDWKIEPRRFRSGVSWLIGGSTNTGNDAELCSTAPAGRDEDPLLCPHGYFCYVEDARDTNKNSEKQNTRGICVKEAEKGSLEQEEEIALTSSLEGSKFCTVDNVVLLEGAKIRLVDKHCRCRKGFLSCSGYKSSEKGATKDRRAKRKNKKKADSKKSNRRKRRRNKDKKKDNVTL